MEVDDAKAVASYIADWWAERLKSGDKDAFRAHLLAACTSSLLERPFLKLECDYDPQGLLLDAVRAAGIECSGFMFSADGILPRKHGTSVYPAREADPEFDQEAMSARLVTKEGYGAWNDPILVSEIVTLTKQKEGGEDG